MKGSVFTEFLSMVDDTFGPETAASLCTAVGVARRDAYAPAGDYAPSEFGALLDNLADSSGASRALLWHAYGMHMCARISDTHARSFERATCCFDWLAEIERELPAVLRELGVAADAASCEFRVVEDERAELVFGCSTPLVDFAGGLIEGAIERFGAAIEVKRGDLADGRALFELRRLA